MRIGILIAGHVPDEMIEKYGDYDRLFSVLLADEKLEFVPYAVVDGIFPKNLDEADGWLITGSKHGAYEAHSWIPPLEQLIRDIYAADQPLIGVCFGHQIIAQALGGKVEKFKGGWVAGPERYQRNDLGLNQNMLAWHQDQVVEKPQGADLLGSSETCVNAVLGYGKNVRTFQAHPEFTPAFISDLLKFRPGLLPDETASHVLTADKAAIDRHNLASEMKAILLGQGS